MSVDIKVDLSRFSKFGKLTDEATREFEAAMTESTLFASTKVSDNTPVSQGLLRNSVFTDEIRTATGLTGIVSSNSAYAVPVELGTKPHTPPLQPLIDWVQQNIVVSGEKEAEKIARAIQFKIRAKGTKGQFMFRDGLAQALPFIQNRFDEAGRRLTNS